MDEQYNWRLEGCQDYVRWVNGVNQDAEDWICSNRIKSDENDTPEQAAHNAVEFIESVWADDERYSDDEIADMAEYFEDLEDSLRGRFEEMQAEAQPENDSLVVALGTA
jgi:hypothetical protein